MNDTLKTIMNRKSVRKFTDKPISEDDIKTILKAGMSGPSCVNSRCWSFIVVQDKEGLLKTLRDQRYFEKPCVKARKKSARARIRKRSRRGRMELN